MAHVQLKPLAVLSREGKLDQLFLAADFEINFSTYHERLSFERETVQPRCHLLRQEFIRLDRGFCTRDSGTNQNKQRESDSSSNAVSGYIHNEVPGEMEKAARTNNRGGICGNDQPFHHTTVD
jgi:hypothetical protein